MIDHGEDGWQKMLPEGIAKIIEDEEFFGYEDQQEPAVDAPV
jgi:hypothetical protein